MKKGIAVWIIGMIVNAMLLASLSSASAHLYGDAIADGILKNRCHFVTTDEMAKPKRR